MLAKAKALPAPEVQASGRLARELRKLTGVGTLTLFATLVLMIYLLPMAYALLTSVSDGGVRDADAPLWPGQVATYSYQGESYEVYKVPLTEGTRDLALIKKGREKSTFVDPQDPSKEIVWDGKWRSLERVWELAPRWGNFGEAWNTIKFGRLFLNTLIIAGTGTFGTLVSSILVAYGFSRFHVPGKNILFLILIGTIILPPQVTLIPTYTLFTKIGWTGSWKPLIVPHFFANAYNVFLLRQFFMTIPKELDEAAMLDGASPLRTLVSIIMPMAWPAVTAVALFHFFFAWNDFFSPLIYLAGKPSLWPISVGIQDFNALYAQQRHLIQAAALLALALPMVIFFMAQRVFMQGVVVTGVEK